MKKRKYKSFSEAVDRDSGLKSLRKKYARATPEKRRKAAEFEYNESMASDMFNMVLALTGSKPMGQPKWPAGFEALAIDPRYAPALLTVGSLEYHYGFEEEAMEMFLTLTKLPADEEDLAEIIDKAGDFLLDQKDLMNALLLYTEAERAYPTEALHCIGSGYCFHKMGNLEEAVARNRRAVELEPDNYSHLNDLGYSLLEAGLLDEAETVLKRSISLSPPTYALPRGNLQTLMEKKPSTRSQVKKDSPKRARKPRKERRESEDHRQDTLFE